ncbi:GcrA-like cell cycle regulator protein [Rhizobium phage RHph_X2_30]|nr:GcrA-like cell cycle regulator protein [Rhizobium phage RHph_X2_30]
MNIVFSWTEDTVTTAAKLWIDGKTITQIGHHFGVSRSAVAAMIYRNRDKFPQKTTGRVVKRAHAVGVKLGTFHWTDEVLQRASAMWKHGDTAKHIAGVLGVNERSFLSVTNRYRGMFPTRLERRPRKPQEPMLDFVDQEAGAERRALDLAQFQIADTTPVRFVDLGAWQCRFPLEAVEAVSGPETPCCGVHAGVGNYYCATHRKVMGTVLKRGR